MNFETGNLSKKFVVAVHNNRWGNYTKEFDKKKEAEEYIASICCDMNTYCFLYKLVSINLEKR